MQALQIIYFIELALTCNYLATLNLINNCKSLKQSLDNVKPKLKIVLDEVKLEYAARLAVCKLLSAKAFILQECKILVPSP